MIQLEMVFALQLAMGILMIIFLQRINRIKKQMNSVIKEVENYISFIMDDDEKQQITKERMTKIENSTGGVISGKRSGKNKKEEEQNRLIQSVLGEYFP